MINVLSGIPYQAAGMGKRKLVDEPDLLLLQAALRPGQSVPPHRANSHVHLLIMQGQVQVHLGQEIISAIAGDLLAVVFQTPMEIKNVSSTDASFLIWKTPNPMQMSGA